MTEPLFNPAELMAVLRDLANDVAEGYKESLQRNGHRATGALIDQVSTEIEVSGSRYIVWINLADYWQYVENDTKPHWPPRDAIISWIKAKPIIPRPFDNGKIPTTEQLAFLIGRAMAGKSPNQANLKNTRGGTTGTHDLRKSEDAIIPYYTERIQAALHRDYMNYIEKILP